MSAPPQISVILCTYNRARSLAKTLESIVEQTLPSSVRWEILVVDNNSKDETPQVVEDFRSRYPERVRYLLEPKQGVSNARNSGVAAARGAILAFIDDDETAGEGWLQNLTANLYNGKWAGAGGRVVPQWTTSRPSWLSPEDSFTTAPLAAFEANPERDQLDEPPFGANMAFRKEVFEKYGGFRTDLGRSGKNLASSEDTEFGRRLLAAGDRLRYEPLSVTYHPVEEYRIHRAYFLAWWFHKGRSDVRESGLQRKGEQSFSMPFHIFRHLAIETVRWTITSDPSRRFISKLKVWVGAGQAYETICQAFNARRNRSKPDSNVPSPAEDAG